MNIPGIVKLNKKSIITISHPGDDYDLSLKINPDKCFYRFSFYLIGRLAKEPGMKDWTDLKNKKRQMLRDKNYKIIFNNKFVFQFSDFLKHIQEEAEFEYENELSLKKIMGPGNHAVRFRGTLLDSIFKKDESYIFKYIGEYGPGLLQNRIIIRKIREWINSKDKNNLHRLFQAFKKAAIISPGPEPLSGTDIIKIMDIYPYLLKEVHKMKLEIYNPLKSEAFDEDTFSEALHKKLKKRKYNWYKTLLKVLAREGNPPKKISIFIKENQPRRIVCKLLGYNFNRGWSSIEKIIRMRTKLRRKNISLY